MNAEIITIGDELLLGQVIDTNSAWMGLELADAGISVIRRTAVGDSEEAIITAITEAQNRVDIVLVTGGLGPTKDDKTKQTLCKLYQCDYRQDETVLLHLEKIFAKRGRQLLEINKQQALLPSACETLFNEEGTAPGMWFEKDGKILISMPGVPYEMKHIMQTQVIERLKKQFTLPFIIHKTLLTANIPESLLSNKLEHIENRLPEHITLSYLPALQTIRLRLTGKGTDRSQLESDIDNFLAEIKTVCAENLVAEGDVNIIEYISKKLIETNMSISVAESCTGGYISNQLILTPGISNVMKGSIISYANEIKIQELGVSPNTIQTEGAVSESCARQMVNGIAKKFNTRIAISTTGIAGPGGGTDEKPVGLIYIGVKVDDKTEVQKFQLRGNREQFMQRAAICAFDMLRAML